MIMLMIMLMIIMIIKIIIEPGSLGNWRPMMIIIPNIITASIIRVRSRGVVAFI